MNINKVQVGDSTAETSTSTTRRCPYTSPKAEQGWECPRCGRINAPWKSQCDCSVNNWTITSDWTYKPEWMKEVTCQGTKVVLDSDTFKVHPDSTTQKAPSSICQSDSSTAKSNPNEKIEVWSNGTAQWGGSDYWDEEKKCYTNGPGISSNCITSANSPWNQYSTLTSQLNKLKYEIEELKETK